MAKTSKQNRPPSTKPPFTPTPKVSPQPTQRAPVDAGNKWQITGFPLKAIVLAIISIVFYCNTFQHEAVYDDDMAIVSNDYVQQGLAGIPKIMTSDAFASYLEHQNGGNQLSGGRYRPLSMILFAIEQQCMGITEEDANTPQSPEAGNARKAKLASDMHVRHVVNVLLYLLCVLAVLELLRSVIFKGQPLLAFFCALLFTIHPLHTEVVAYVKSSDEILSVLFISLTFVYAHRDTDQHKRSTLLKALACFFLALLSKEYAITLAVLLPLSFYLFAKMDMKGAFKASLPYLIPLGIYAALRMAATGAISEGAVKEIINYPYLYASAPEKLATELFILLKYLGLLFVPNPLISDYSFHAIPYTNFSNPLVWLAGIVYIAMVAAFVVLMKKRQAISFAIAFYLLNLLLVSNILFNIGAPMGDRLIFHSSLGFCMIAGYIIFWGLNRFAKASMPALLGIVSLVLIVSCGYVTIARNADWKNNVTLFLADVKKAPDDVVIDNNAGAACLAMAAKNAADTSVRVQWWQRGVSYLSHAIALYPQYSMAYFNRGTCYFRLGKMDSALNDFDTAAAYHSGQAKLEMYRSAIAQYYFRKGMDAGRANNQQAAIAAFSKATRAAPEAPDIWYNLGYAYYSAGNIQAARQAWQRTLQLAPGNEQARTMYAKAGGDSISNATQGRLPK